jgi:hypothetical protein
LVGEEADTPFSLAQTEQRWSVDISPSSMVVS